MFEDAVADELIPSNPYAVKRGELPPKIDKDPTWRSGAVFTREEVERLIWMNEFPKSAASFTPSSSWEVLDCLSAEFTTPGCTFVSLSLADGARKDILRWISHGPEGDVVSLYTSLPWTALCEEVAKFSIGLRTGQLLELRKAANSSNEPENRKADLLQPLLPSQRVNEKAPESRRLENSCESAQGGTRRRHGRKIFAGPRRYCRGFSRSDATRARS